MLIDYVNGQTGIVLRVRIIDSSVSTGAGKTGLSSSSTGLIISTIADNEATPTAYTVAGTTIESVTTLGTFATPTSTKCRFREVSSTNHPGIYELQIDNARFAVANAKSLLISITGATNAADCHVCIPLRSVNPYDATRFGMSALPNTSCTTNASLLTSGTGTDQISVSAGKVLLQATQTGVTIPTVTTVGSVTTVSDKTGYSLATAPPTAAAIATAVWQDTTAGDFTVVSSIGKSLYTSGNAPGAASGIALVGSNVGAAASVTAGVTVSTNNDKTGYTVSTVSDKTGYSLAAAGLDSIVVETGVNARQALSPILAAAAGVLSGATTGTIVVKGGNVATTRITATTDANGNRSAVTLSLPT
jgi:hypothetical protein